MGTRFARGNFAAKKLHWIWTEERIRAYQTNTLQPIIDLIGLKEVARLTGYQPEYIKLLAGYYTKVQQPSEEFVRRFDRAVFLHHIRAVVIPFLRAREGQGPGRSWSKRRARIAKSRQKR